MTSFATLAVSTLWLGNLLLAIWAIGHLYLYVACPDAVFVDLANRVFHLMYRRIVRSDAVSRQRREQDAGTHQLKARKLSFARRFADLQGPEHQPKAQRKGTAIRGLELTASIFLRPYWWSRETPQSRATSSGLMRAVKMLSQLEDIGSSALMCSWLTQTYIRRWPVV